MVVLADLLVAALTATVVVAVLGVGKSRRPPEGVGVLLILVLFLTIWAGGVWIVPLGRPLLGVSVLSFAVIGLVLALLVAAFVPPRPPRTRGEALRQDDARREARRATTVFAWLLVAVLVTAIVARYV